MVNELDRRLLIAQYEPNPTIPRYSRQVEYAFISTSRHPLFLLDTIALARRVAKYVVVLCSQHSYARTINSFLVNGASRNHAVIHTDSLALPQRLRFEASDHRMAHSMRAFDISKKRGIAELMAELLGASAWVHLDDDVKLSSEVKRAAIDLLQGSDRYGDSRSAKEGFRLVGVPVLDMVDTSYAKYIQLELGDTDDLYTFPGGGLLFVSHAATGHFPFGIYNEDQLMMYWDLDYMAMVGRAEQKWFDPFQDPNRGFDNAFGDLFADGIYHFRAYGIDINQIGYEGWNDFYQNRRDDLETLSRRVPKGQLKLETAISGLLNGMDGFGPHDLIQYGRQFVRDNERWVEGRERVRGQQEPRSLRQALKELGLEGCTLGPLTESVSDSSISAPIELVISEQSKLRSRPDKQCQLAGPK